MATLDCLPSTATGTDAMREWCARNDLDPATTLDNLDVQPMVDGRWLLTYHVLDGGYVSDELTKIVDDHPPMRPPHQWVDITEMGDRDHQYTCTGCGAHKTEPREACAG